MGWLDFLFKRPKTGAADQGITLSDAKKLVIDATEKQLSPTYPQCEKYCKDVLKETEAAKNAAKVIIESKLDKNRQHYQIALQMQRNFAERAPQALAAMKMPQKKDYDSFAAFHSASIQMISKTSQISQDNRYLPFFLDAEMGAFGTHMNKLIELTNSLGTLLEPGKELKKQVEKAKMLEARVYSLDKETKDLAGLRKDILEQNKELETKAANAAAINEKVKAEETEIQKRIDVLRTKSTDNLKEITNSLSQFQRQFKKMQRLILEKEVTKALDKYINEPESMIMAEVESTNDYPLLKKILESTRKELENGKLEPEEKIRSRRLAAISEIVGGSLTETVKKAIQFNKELADEETSLYEISKKMANINEIRRTIQQNLEKIAKAEKKEATANEELSKAVSEFESIIEAVAGKQIKIKSE